MNSERVRCWNRQSMDYDANCNAKAPHQWRATSRSSLNTLNLSLPLWLLLAGSALLNSGTAQTTTDDPQQWIRTPRTTLRLPNTTQPLHYHLHISSRIDRADLNYTSNVTIHIQVRESTNEIVLHAKNLSGFVITVNDLDTGELRDDLTHSYEETGHFLIIHPVQNYQAFEAGQQLRVEILYSAIMCDKTNGIYWMTYNDANNRSVYLAATQFEPTSARLALPCYDEPAFKANFSISLTHSSHYMALSNMPVQQVHIHGEDKELTTTKFETTPVISTYLVAFVISNFEHIADEYRGVTQRIYTSPQTPDKGHRALKNAVRCVAALEDYFGIAYPLAKLDHIALQKNYGAAMENWGLITYKEDNLVYQDDTNVHRRLKDTLTQNHEIAHQWFGNLVSPEWWTYAWLNEGFATYFGYIITDLLYPQYKVMEFFLTDIAERAINYGYISVRPMTYYVEKESEIMSIFDIISYQRAACVLKMFHHSFGRKTFVRGISDYLLKFQYLVANELQLFESIQAALQVDAEAHNEDVDWISAVPQIMISWTHSEWMPILTIVRNYDDDTITIRQRSKDLNSEEQWWIPLNFASASSADFENTRADYFMPPMSEVVLTPKELGMHQLQRDDWLIANKQQTGFYHIIYDDTNLLMIVKQLQRNHTVIHPLNRVALFQDYFPLIENNEIQSVEIVFEMLKYLQQESDMLPWNFVSDFFEFFEKNLYGTKSYQLFHQFARQLVTPIYDQLFKAPQKEGCTSTELKARQNVLTLACNADLQDCLDRTRELAHDYIFRLTDDRTNETYYGMHDSVLCMAVKYLSDDEFNTILDLLSQAERNTVWYDDIIFALRCTQSRSHLRQYLYLLLGENSTHSIMGDSESLMYVFYLYNTNMAARPVMWRFIESNYKHLCHSAFFIENFNRLAEYVPQRHLEDFQKLRSAIAAELKAAGPEESLNKLISADATTIGKKVRLSEQFLKQFGQNIYDWLVRELMPTSYSSAFGASNSSNRLTGALYAIRKHFHKFLQRRSFRNT